MTALSGGRHRSSPLLCLHEHHRQHSDPYSNFTLQPGQLLQCPPAQQSSALMGAAALGLLWAHAGNEAELQRRALHGSRGLLGFKPTPSPCTSQGELSSGASSGLANILLWSRGEETRIIAAGSSRSAAAMFPGQGKAYKYNVGAKGSSFESRQASLGTPVPGQVTGECRWLHSSTGAAFLGEVAAAGPGSAALQEMCVPQLCPMATHLLQDMSCTPFRCSRAPCAALRGVGRGSTAARRTKAKLRVLPGDRCQVGAKKCPHALG